MGVNYRILDLVISMGYQKKRPRSTNESIPRHSGTGLGHVFQQDELEITRVTEKGASYFLNDRLVFRETCGVLVFFV